MRSGERCIVDDAGTIAVIFGDEPDEAIAILEAVQKCTASQELYDALQDLISWVPSGHWHTDEPQKAVERARAALAKAAP